MKAPFDHTNYPKNLKHRTDLELAFMINDCREALAAFPESENAGYYQDEIHYISAEMNHRRTAKPNSKTTAKQRNKAEAARRFDINLENAKASLKKLQDEIAEYEQRMKDNDGPDFGDVASMYEVASRLHQTATFLDAGDDYYDADFQYAKNLLESAKRK